MKKSKLLLPLFLGSFFIPTIGYSASYNSFENKTVPNQNLEILIASPGGHGGGGKKTKEQQNNIEENKKKVQENAKIRIKTNIKNSDDLMDDFWGSGNIYATIVIKTINNIAKESLIKGLKEDINNLPEIFDEEETALKNIPLFNRSLAFTEKAFEAQENGETEKAKILSELAFKSTIREEKIINKKSIKKQLAEKLSDANIVDSIKFTLFGLNSLILEDYEEGNRNFKKALNNKEQDTANLKSLVAFTEIASGNINQGCSDIEELILDGTIDIDDVDDFLLEEMCRSPF